MPSNNPPCLRYSMKNGSCPSGVTGALLSHSTWTRPAKVSATTRPVDTLPTTAGSSPIGSLGITSRFVPIPYDNNDLLNCCTGYISDLGSYSQRGSVGILVVERSP